MHRLIQHAYLLVDGAIVAFLAYAAFGDAPQGVLNLTYALTALFALSGFCVMWDEDPKKPRYPAWSDYVTRGLLTGVFVYVGWWWCAAGWFVSWLSHAIKWSRLEEKKD